MSDLGTGSILKDGQLQEDLSTSHFSGIMLAAMSSTDHRGVECE
jgi:hypothetical protein